MPFVQVGTYPTRNFATLGPFAFVTERILCGFIRTALGALSLHVAMEAGLYHVRWRFHQRILAYSL